MLQVLAVVPFKRHQYPSSFTVDRQSGLAGCPILSRFLRKGGEAFHAAGFLAFSFADPVASPAGFVLIIGMLRLRRGTSSSRLRSA
jgi:hypothetical protein